MNVFALDADPKVAARAMCDVHLRKMCLEAAQILSTAAMNGGFGKSAYAPTHPGNKCVQWAGRSRDNWDWLVEHGMEAHAAYRDRFQKGHRSFGVLLWARRLQPLVESFPERGPTIWADAVYPLRQEPFSSFTEAVLEYQAYYARKEAVWAFQCRSQVLQRMAIGDKPHKGGKQQMSWTAPDVRPPWLPGEPPPGWPTEAQIAVVIGASRRGPLPKSDAVGQALVALAAELVPSEAVIEALHLARDAA